MQASISEVASDPGKRTVNGWYNSALAVSFPGSDAASGFHSCSPERRYEGPDSIFAVVTGTRRDNAGNVSLGSFALKYDAAPSQVSGARADREPDGNGWYNHPLTVRFFGSDAPSDIDSCTTVGYSGPSNPTAAVAGSCRDRSGNPSNPGTFAFKYDNTTPSVSGLTVKAATGARW